MNDWKKNLSVGTASFGGNYGLFSTKNKITDCELFEIFATAKQHGIRSIDTSPLYGDAEVRLGTLGVQNLLISSKVWASPNLETIDKTDFGFLVEKSLKRLKVKKLDAVLLHNTNEIKPDLLPRLISELSLLKQKKLCEKIGISCYEANQALEIIKNFDIDVVQVPGNILDRRLLTSGLLAVCKKKDIEAHIRSIFLGGLLLRSTPTIPKEFQKWKKLLKLWESWLELEGITHLQANMSFAQYLLKEGASKIIVGVSSAEELLKIVSTSSVRLSGIPENLATDDRQLINPYNWQ